MKKVYTGVIAGLVFSIAGSMYAVNSLYVHDGKMIPSLMIPLTGVLCFPFTKAV